ncbi:MAG: tRNA (adenosine(37)-N6)-threonylcarbamoyltransferase complex dimerization subunit type 1 TsaB [Eubacteriales bacterium]
MKVLALDSSGLVASVALVTEEQVIGEYTINYKKTHSQTLLPMLDVMFKQLDMEIAEIDAIAVSGGPGSFTGLRIGAATAKGLGLALDKPLIHIPTAEGMAYQMYGVDGLICPIMDARRAQVYTGIYAFDTAGEPSGEADRSFHVIEAQMAIAMEDLIEKLNYMGQPVTFLGDGVPVHRTLLEEKLVVPYFFAPSYCNRQSAAAVGALGIEYYQAGKIESAAEHQPDYLRVSQAERERAEKEMSK